MIGFTVTPDMFTHTTALLRIEKKKQKKNKKKNAQAHRKRSSLLQQGETPQCVHYNENSIIVLLCGCVHTEINSFYLQWRVRVIYLIDHLHVSLCGIEVFPINHKPNAASSVPARI